MSVATTLATVKAEAIIASGNLVAVDNPFQGENPDFEFFGVQFKNALVGLVTGLWGVVIIVLGGALLWNSGKWGWARQRGMSDDMEDGATGMKRSGAALLAVALFGVIIGAILQVTGNFTS